MLTMTGVCAVLAVPVLFFILGYLVINGGTSVNWNFFTKLPSRWRNRRRHGQCHRRQRKGLAAGHLFGVPIGFLGGIYLAEFSGKGDASIVRYAADLLNGVPSIVWEFLRIAWRCCLSSIFRLSPGELPWA